MLFDSRSRVRVRKQKICSGRRIFGQVTKGTRRMPWHQQAMKDVVSCDKRRRGANILRSGDLRMGKPGPGNTGSSSGEFIA